jgi:bacterioferritin (cytochrome b1)
MIEYFKDFDTTTRKMLVEIQASEEQHADDLSELLGNLPQTSI